jgi:Ca2+-binding EF-hand superfamily protein
VKFATDQDLDEEETLLCLKLRDAFRDLGPDIDSRDKKLMEIFLSFDEDDSGFLDQKEFEKFLSTCKLKLDAKTIELIWDIFDSDGNGEMEYEEFLWFVYPEVNETIIKNKLIHCFNLFQKEGVVPEDLFAVADKRNDGLIDRLEARQILLNLVNEALIFLCVNILRFRFFCSTGFTSSSR